MKKLFVIFFIVLCSINAFALYDSDITNGCSGSYRFAPVFQINSYTCQSGYFLPANAVACVACPTGATCNGGTFTFNPDIAQGIELNYPFNNTITNGCSGNLTGGYVPVFVPNSISLTWQDDNGNTIDSGTCSYGEAISVPSTTPTKTGYTFAGWQVVSN